MLAFLSGSANAGEHGVRSLPPTQSAAGGAILGSTLGRVFAASRAHGVPAALATARTQSLAVANGRVRVIIEPGSGGVRAAETAVVGATGGIVEAQADGLVQALVAPGALQRLASNPAVSAVRPACNTGGTIARRGRFADGCERVAGRGGRRDRGEDRDHRPWVLRLPVAARDSAAGVCDDRRPLRRQPRRVSRRRWHAARDGGRRTRPSDGARSADLPDVRRHRGRSRVGRAGRRR